MKNKEYALSVGKYIADRRKDKNLTQLECCNACGISRSTMSDIEKGSRLPSSTDMLSLCAVLDVTPNDIYSYGSKDADIFKNKNKNQASSDIKLFLKASCSYFMLSRQSKALVSSLLYNIAKDEIGPSYQSVIDRIDDFADEIIDSDLLDGIIFSKVNGDREKKGLELLNTDQRDVAIAEFMDSFLNWS